MLPGRFIRASYRSSFLLRRSTHSLTSPTVKMASEEALSQEIVQQSQLVNKLKAEQADSAIINEANKKLGELKKARGQLLAVSSGSKDLGKKKERLLLKTAKVHRTPLPFINFHLIKAL